MMKCEKYKNLIHLYIDGALLPKEQDELFAHVNQCEHCSAYFDDMVALADELFEEDVEIPYAFSTAWRARVADMQPKRRGISFKMMIPALAACVCGVFVISTALINPEAFGAGLANLVSRQNYVEAGAADVAETPAAEAAVFLPEEQPADAEEQEPPTEDGMLDEITEAAPSTTVAEGTLNDSSAGTAATDDAAKAAESAGAGKSTAAGAAVGLQTIDATGKKLKAKIAEVAVGNQVAVTETEGGLILDGATEALNKVLAAFQLGSVPAPQTSVKILCEL